MSLELELSVQQAQANAKAVNAELSLTLRHLRAIAAQSSKALGGVRLSSDLKRELDTLKEVQRVRRSTTQETLVEEQKRTRAVRTASNARILQTRREVEAVRTAANQERQIQRQATATHIEAERRKTVLLEAAQKHRLLQERMTGDQRRAVIIAQGKERELLVKAQQAKELEALKQANRLKLAEHRAQMQRENATLRGSAMFGGMRGGNQAAAGFRAGLYGAGVSMGIYTGSTIAVAAAAYSVSRAMTEAIRVGLQFEQTMAQAMAVMQSAGGGELSQALRDQLSSGVRQIAMETVWTAQEAAEALRYLGMAGFSAEAGLAALRPVLDLATIGMMDAGRAADIATNIMTGFSLPVEGLAKVVDQMALSVTRSNQTIEEMGVAMSYVAPVAAISGSSIESVMAALESMAAAGIKGSRAGTSLRNIFMRLGAPTNAARESIARLGVEIYRIDEAGNAVLRPLEELVAEFARLGPEHDSAIARLMGARAWPAFAKMLQDARADFVEVNGEMIAGVDSLRHRIATLGDADGYSDKVIKQLLEPLQNQLRLVKSAAQEAGLQFYELFVEGELKSLAADMREFFLWLGSNQSEGAVTGLRALRQELDTVDSTTRRVVDTISTLGQMLMLYFAGRLIWAGIARIATALAGLATSAAGVAAALPSAFSRATTAVVGFHNGVYTAGTALTTLQAAARPLMTLLSRVFIPVGIGLFIAELTGLTDIFRNDVPASLREADEFLALHRNQLGLTADMYRQLGNAALQSVNQELLASIMKLDQLEREQEQRTAEIMANRAGRFQDPWEGDRQTLENIELERRLESIKMMQRQRDDLIRAQKEIQRSLEEASKSPVGGGAAVASPAGGGADSGTDGTGLLLSSIRGDVDELLEIERKIRDTRGLSVLDEQLTAHRRLGEGLREQLDQGQISIDAYVAGVRTSTEALKDAYTAHFEARIKAVRDEHDVDAFLSDPNYGVAVKSMQGVEGYESALERVREGLAKEAELTRELTQTLEGLDDEAQRLARSAESALSRKRPDLSEFRESMEELKQATAEAETVLKSNFENSRQIIQQANQTLGQDLDSGLATWAGYIQGRREQVREEHELTVQYLQDRKALLEAAVAQGEQLIAAEGAGGSRESIRALSDLKNQLREVKAELGELEGLEAGKVFQDLAKAINEIDVDVAERIAKMSKSLQKSIVDLSRHNSQFGNLRSLWKDLGDAAVEYNLAQLEAARNMGLLGEEGVRQLEHLKSAYLQLVEAQAMGQLTNVWVSGVQDIENAFYDFFSNGFRNFEDFAERLRGAFEKLLMDLVYTALKNEIFFRLNIGGTVGGLPGAGSGFGGTGGVTDIIKGVGKALGFGGAGWSAGIGAANVGLGAAGAATGASALGASAGAGAGWSAGIGAANVGLGAAGATTGAAALAGAGTGIGAAIGAALPVLAPLALLAFGGFGKKPPNRPAYGSVDLATGATFGLGAGSGAKGASAETIGARDTFLSAAATYAQALNQMGGNVTGSLGVDIGERDGVQVDFGDGRGPVSLGSDVEAAMQTVFEYLLEGAEGLEEPFKALLKAFQGTAEEALGYATDLASLHKVMTTNPLHEYRQAQEEANRTVWEGAQVQRDALMDLIQSYDGSAAATADLARAAEEAAAAFVAVIAQIDAARAEIEASFADTREKMMLDTMSDSEKYDYYKSEADRIVDQLKTETDPLKILELGRQLDELIRKGWDLLDDDQKKIMLEQFLGYSDAVEQLVNSRLDVAEELAYSVGQALQEAIGDVLSAAADKIAVAADAMVDAANTPLDVRVTVADERTAEVGSRR